MKYLKPEIKILKLDVEDVIATSGDNDYTPDPDQTPVVPRNRSGETGKYWENN
jgi:hypothetical protein